MLPCCYEHGALQLIRILSYFNRSYYIWSYRHTSKSQTFFISDWTFNEWPIVNLNPSETKGTAVATSKNRGLLSLSFSRNLMGLGKIPKWGMSEIGNPWCWPIINVFFPFTLILTTCPFSRSTLLVWKSADETMSPRHLGATCCSRWQNHGSCTVLVSTSAFVPETETASGRDMHMACGYSHHRWCSTRWEDLDIGVGKKLLSS